MISPSTIERKREAMVFNELEGDISRFTTGKTHRSSSLSRHVGPAWFSSTDVKKDSIRRSISQNPRLLVFAKRTTITNMRTNWCLEKKNSHLILGLVKWPFLKINYSLFSLSKAIKPDYLIDDWQEKVETIHGFCAKIIKWANLSKIGITLEPKEYLNRLLSHLRMDLIYVGVMRIF